jgi:hypothetical protein
MKGALVRILKGKVSFSWAQGLLQRKWRCPQFALLRIFQKCLPRLSLSELRVFCHTPFPDPSLQISNVLVKWKCLFRTWFVMNGFFVHSFYNMCLRMMV